MKKFLTICVVCLISTNANAYHLRGIGMESCASWSTSRGVESVLFMQWALGFLSGADSVRHPDYAEGHDIKIKNMTLLEMVNAYCREHPLKPVATALEITSDEFERERGHSKGSGPPLNLHPPGGDSEVNFK